MVDKTSKKTKIISHFRSANNMYKSMLVDGNCLSPSATTIRKTFLINNDLFFNESNEFAIVEDYDLWLNIAKKGAKITFLNRTLGDYIVDGENMISDLDRYISNLGNLYKYHAYLIQDFEPKKDKLYNILTANIHFMKLKQNLKRKQYLEVLFEFIKVLRKSITFLPLKILSKALS